MMNRSQIGLKLAMDIIGIPVCVENYREICDAVYHAWRIGVYISHSRIEWDWQKMRAWSPRTQERCFSHNLRDDVAQIQAEIEGSLKHGVNDDSFGYKMDEPTAIKLKNLYQKAPEVYIPQRISPSSCPLAP